MYFLIPTTRLKTLKRALRTLVLIAICWQLSACSTLSYYVHITHGQYTLLSLRRPIDDVLADRAVDETLKRRLRLAQRARAFASSDLDLPENGSYTLYADLGRSSAVWNVFATPEFSLQPVTYCFLVAGCVAYRGYYDKSRAFAAADVLRAQGKEAFVGSVAAYSTLGWFDDPILNTMMSWDDDELVGTLFHELTHQKLYVKDDTSFNESLATFVEHEGTAQWRAAEGEPPSDAAVQRRQDQFTQLVLDTRERLARLYASGLPPDEMRLQKAKEFERMQADYQLLRDGSWGGYSGYDAWMKSDLNNARLLPFGLYHRWVPAFANLYAQQNRNWPDFFRAAKKIAGEASAKRQQTLEGLEAAHAE